MCAQINIKWVPFKCTGCEQQFVICARNPGWRGIDTLWLCPTQHEQYCHLYPRLLSPADAPSPLPCPWLCRSLRSDTKKKKITDKGFANDFSLSTLAFTSSRISWSCCEVFRCISTTSCFKRYQAPALKIICWIFYVLRLPPSLPLPKFTLWNPELCVTLVIGRGQ